MPTDTTEHLGCPLNAVDRRLEDVHRLWHQAEAGYFEPEAFRVGIQSAIQTLRTVTFVLQKNKPSIPNFDDWYKRWQDELKSDGRMQWLVDARNKIEKEGDLEAQSLIRANIVASYLDEGPGIEVRANLFDGVKALLKSIPEGALGKHIKQTGTLSIQRRWVENTLPDHELLDTVAYGYAFISRLVADAHRQIGLPAAPVRDHATGETIDPVALGGRLPCMIEHDEPRTVLVSLKDGVVLERTKSAFKYDTPELEKAGKRYNISPGAISNRKFATNEELARAYFEAARTMFLKDGQHLPMVFLLKERTFIGVYAAPAADQQQKYLLYRALAREALRKGADAVLAIHEVWLANVADVGPYEGASSSTTRAEGLCLFVATSAGDTFQLMAPIKRDGGAVTLGETDLIRGMAAFAMAPFLQIWGRKIPDEWVERMREWQKGEEKKSR